MTVMVARSAGALLGPLPIVPAPYPRRRQTPVRGKILLVRPPLPRICTEGLSVQRVCTNLCVLPRLQRPKSQLVSAEGLRLRGASALWWVAVLQHRE